MEFIFYFTSGIAILATLNVITNKNPIHALLYLIISILSIAIVFFTIGAPFAAILEVIVYAGAIMVLFVFVVMMLNLGKETELAERKILSPKMWLFPSILSALLLIQLFFAISQFHSGITIGHTEVEIKSVAISLFGPYLIAVELAAILLLATLVTAFHLGRPAAKEIF